MICSAPGCDRDAAVRGYDVALHGLDRRRAKVFRLCDACYEMHLTRETRESNPRPITPLVCRSGVKEIK